MLGLASTWRSPRARRVFGLASLGLALSLTALAGWKLAGRGWPLSGARPDLAVAAGLLFLLGYPFKALGWSRLFAPHQRPDTFSLAAAGGAASVLGVALPGRFDDVVRVAVVRRCAPTRAGLPTLGLSLVALGLLDAVAFVPLASAAAALTESTALRIGLAVVAGAGVAAACVVLLVLRLGVRQPLLRFRVAAWLHEHRPSTGETAAALALVLASWLARGLALVLLLGALGIGLSPPLALVFLCAGAASAAVPIGPAGAAVQAGAGAAILVASGVGSAAAIDFAVASQSLAVMAGGVVMLSGFAWHAGRRLVTA